MRRPNIVEEISNKIKKMVPYAKIILFGSEARGDATKDSDIDLLILIPDNVKREFNLLRSSISDALFELELKYEVLISPLILLQSMWERRTTPFTINVQKEGIEL